MIVLTQKQNKTHSLRSVGRRPNIEHHVAQILPAGRCIDATAAAADREEDHLDDVALQLVRLQRLLVELPGELLHDGHGLGMLDGIGAQRLLVEAGLGHELHVRSSRKVARLGDEKTRNKLI